MLIVLIILIITNKNNFSKFGTLLEKYIINRTNSPVNVYSVVNQSINYDLTPQNNSGPQVYVTLNLYTGGVLMYFFYYGGNTAYQISTDPTRPTVLTLNATGGHQTKGTGNPGRYVRIFNNTARNSTSWIPLMFFVDGYGDMVDKDDATSVGLWKYGYPTAGDGRTLPGPITRSIGNTIALTAGNTYTFRIDNWGVSNFQTPNCVTISQPIAANGGTLQKDNRYMRYGLRDFKGYVNNVKTVFPYNPTVYYLNYEWVNNNTNDILSSTQLFRLNLNKSSSGTGSGTVTSSQTGLDASTSSGNYGLLVSGTIITLTATPDSVSSTFAGWSDDASGNNSPLTITMDSDKTVMATFNKKQYRLNLNISSSGTGSGTVTVKNGNNILTGNSGDYGLFDISTELTLTANPDVSSTFAGWSSDASGNNSPLTIRMDSDKSVMATFNKKQYTLTINTNGSTGNGSVTTVPAPVNGLFDSGTVVTLTATPNSQSNFWTWSNNVTSTGQLTGTITMNSNQTVTVTFKTKQYILYINRNGTGTGTVRYQSSNGIYLQLDTVITYFGPFYHGTMGQLIAIPDGGNMFAGWSGSITSSNETVDITMDNTKTLMATFNKLQYRLIINKSGSGSGTVTSSPIGGSRSNTPGDYGLFDPNTRVTLIATSEGGSSFAGWPGVSGKTTTIIMNNNKEFTATFNPPAPIIQYTLFFYGDAGTGTGTATVKNLQGIVLQPTNDLGDYEGLNANTDLVLTATPDRGSDFVAWGLDNGDVILSTNNPYTVTMDSDKTIAPIFNKKQYRLTGSTNGSGTGTVTVNIGYTTLTGNSAGDYGLFDFGTVLVLTATPTGTSVFAGWPGVSGTTTTITMDNNKVFTATFNKLQYRLTINTTGGSGSGTVTSSPIGGSISNTPGDYGLFDPNTRVTLTATPTGTSVFAGWPGVSGTTTTITMDNNKVLLAIFILPAQIQYSLTVKKDGTGTGTVTVKNGNTTLTSNSFGGYGSFNTGTIFTITATPTGTSIFAGWSGSTSTLENSVSITLDTSKSVTAKFLSNPSSVPYAQYNCPIILY